MWLIGKNLKKRHHLKDDVRESFYDAVNFWLKALRAKGTTFMGGDQPGIDEIFFEIDYLVKIQFFQTWQIWPCMVFCALLKAAMLLMNYLKKPKLDPGTMLSRRLA